MRTLGVGLVVASACFLTARPLDAQICTGGPPLAGSPGVNVGASASFFDGGKQYGAGATVGSSLFASAAFSHADFDDTDASLKTISGGVGYEYQPSPPVELTICPLLGVAHGFGLEIVGVDFTLTTIAPSLAIGVSVEMTSSLSLVPFAQASVLFQRGSADAGPLGEGSEWETNGAVGLGAGLMFNERVSIGPSVSIPFAREDGNTSFSIGFAVALGGS